MCENTPELVSAPVSSCDFVSMYNFFIFNPPESPRSVYRSLVMFCFELFLSGVDLKLGEAMASSSGDKEKTPPEDDNQNSKLEEGQITAGSRTREPTLVGSISTGRAFSHNLQGPIPPVLDLSSYPASVEALRVTNEFCDKYRALRMEVEILREENNRLRRMLEDFLTPIMIAPPPPKE
jgi:hypothetical protein